MNDLFFFKLAFFAILSAILLAISSIEFTLTKGTKMRLSDEKERYFKNAMTFAFFGIIASTVLAIFPKIVSLKFEQEYYIAPALLILSWAFFHYKASNTIDVQSIQEEYDARLKDAIRNFVSSKGTEQNPVTANDVYNGLVSSFSYLNFDSKTMDIMRVFTRDLKPVGKFLDIIQGFNFSHDKIQIILMDLCSQGVLKKNKDNMYYL